MKDKTTSRARPQWQDAHRRGHVPLVPEKIPAVASGAASPGSARVMAAFQETMQAFLEVQRTTMLAYLSGRQLEPTTLPANPLEKKASPNDRPRST